MSEPAFALSAGTAPHGVTLAAQITCPDCGKLARAFDLRDGSGWGQCGEPTRRRGACPGQWFAIAIAPGANGAWLQRQCGTDEANALIRAACGLGADVPDAQLQFIALDRHSRVGYTGDRPSYLVISVRGRDRHHYRHASLAAILRAVGLLP